MLESRRPGGCEPPKTNISARTVPRWPKAQSSTPVPRLRAVRRAAVIALALAVVLAVGSAGCGSGENTPEQELVSAGQVIGQFKRDTGKPLQRAATEDPAWDQLSYGLDPSQELLDQYGIFSVYVAKQGHVDALGSLLRDK